MGPLSVIAKTFSRWSDHEGQRLGAALAFYSLLSTAPLLVVALFIVSTVVGQSTAEQRIIAYAEQILGPNGVTMVQTILAHARQPHGADIAALVALVALFFGASGAFLELRDDLNKMWDARPRSKGFWGIVLQRMFAFMLVIATGVLLLVSMLATAAVSVMAKFFSNLIPVPPLLLEAANIIVSFFLLAGVFLLIFRFVPDRALPWRLLWPGAVVSAVLFAAGKIVLALYLAKAAVGSAYGAAGSVIAVAFFVYYSAQIFLFGAEFTYIWARRETLEQPPKQPAKQVFARS